MYFVFVLIALSILLVEHGSPTLLSFLGLFVCCAAAYPMLHHQKCKTKGYHELSFERKMFVLSNTIKGTCLGACTPMAVLLLFECSQGRWDTRSILMMDHMYAVLDAVSLVMVERMQRSTVVHHVAVLLVHIQNCQQDFSEDTYARCSVVYAIFSCFAFQVNLVLAKRHETPNFKLAFFTYMTACLLNWTWQIYYAWTHPVSVFAVVWWTFLCAIVYDDVFLLRWLHKSMHHKYGEGIKKKRAV